MSSKLILIKFNLIDFINISKKIFLYRKTKVQDYYKINFSAKELAIFDRLIKTFILSFCLSFRDDSFKQKFIISNFF
jgi:hypothetical protein